MQVQIETNRTSRTFVRTLTRTVSTTLTFAVCGMGPSHPGTWIPAKGHFLAISDKLNCFHSLIAESSAIPMSCWCISTVWSLEQYKV